VGLGSILSGESLLSRCRYFRDLQEATIILTLLSRGWQFSGGGSLLLEVHGICFVLKFK